MIKIQQFVVALAVVGACCAVGSAAGSPLSRHLLETTPAQPSDSSPPNLDAPCFVSYSPQPYMTATSKCPNDQFYVSFVTFDGSNNVTWISGADATPVSGAVKHMWVGPFQPKPRDEYLVILRASDGKIITPKGIKPDGSFYDISGTGRKVCQLFEQGSTPLRFGIFRASATPNGLNVLRDDFYNKKNPGSMPKGGVPCESYVDPGPGLNPKSAGKFGKLVYAYKPGGCRFGIDDCSA